MTAPSDSVRSVLAAFRQRADHLNAAFPSTTWRRLRGPGPDELTLDGTGRFIGLRLERASELVLRARLELPGSVDGVPLVGEPLELTISSLYPLDLRHDGRSIFSDPGVPVAAGPALFTAIPALIEGDNGELELSVRLPSNQTYPWLGMRLTTASLRREADLADLHWAELALADALATGSERDLVSAAAEALAEPGFRPDEASLAFLEETLAPLQVRARAPRVHLIGHSHIDLSWLWRWRDTVEVIKRDFRSVLGLMEEFPELTFTHSQAATYEVIRREEPDLFARVLEHIQSGRWEAACLSWVEADTNLPSGESLARQMLHGANYAREVLGTTVTTYLAPDNFGHAGNLPQLVRDAGGERYYHHRVNPGGSDFWPAYWWEGQDGSRLLAISTGSYNGALKPRDLVESAIRALRHGHGVTVHFHGMGDHGGGPTWQAMHLLRKLQGRPLLPDFHCSTLAAYAADLLAGDPRLPTHRGELNTLFEGCYTTHAQGKAWNRAEENALATAETLAVLAGLDRRAELAVAWRSTLLNQFHDIVCGSSISEVYDDQKRDHEAAMAAARSVAEDALSRLSTGNTPGSIAVTNPSAWERRDWVTVPGLAGTGAVWLEAQDGELVAGQFGSEGLGFVARVGALGTSNYSLRPDLPQQLPPDLVAEPAFAPTDDRQHNPLAEAGEQPPYLNLRAGSFRVAVHRASGIIASLRDERVGRELVAFGQRRPSDYHDGARLDLALGVLQLVEEYPHPMSAWHLDEVYRETSLIRGADTRVVETGPCRIVLETVHGIGSSTITQRTCFYRDLERMDFRTSIDWRDEAGPERGIPNLKVAFTASLPDCEAWFEAPFAAVRRPADGQETPALRWADVGGSDYGIALLNDGRYGHDALGNRLRLSLVRSAYDPDPLAGQGNVTTRYSLMPHHGSWRTAGVPRAATAFNQPLLAAIVTAATSAPATEGLPQVECSEGVTLSACKLAEDGTGIVLRFCEAHGQDGSARIFGLPPTASVVEIDLTERRKVPINAHEEELTLKLRPWQIRSILVGKDRVVV